MDFEAIIGNAGDTLPIVSDAPTASEVSDSAIDTAAPALSGEEKPSEAQSTTEETQIQEPAAEGTPGEEEEITDEAIEKALADKRTGKWFKNAIALKNKHLSEREAALQEYSTLGTKEEIQEARDFREQLFGFDEKDGQIVSKTGAFAADFLAKHTEKGIELINHMITQKSPYNPNETVFETILNAPSIQEYLKSKYGFSDSPIEGVPAEFAEAYKALPKELKDSFEFATDAEKAAMLQTAQIGVDANKREADRVQAEKQAKEVKFQEDVQKATAANFDTVTNQFGESLKAIPFSSDPKQNGFLQFAVRDAVFTAATMSETQAGKNAFEELKSIGVEFPADVPALVKRLEKYSQYAETFKSQNNAASYNQTLSEIATIQKQLTARSNQVAAQIAKFFGVHAKAKAEEKNELLTNPTRPSVTGGGGEGKPTTNYADLSFAEIMAMP